MWFVAIAFDSLFFCDRAHKVVTEAVHQHDGKICMQVIHKYDAVCMMDVHILHISGQADVDLCPMASCFTYPLCYRVP